MNLEQKVIHYAVSEEQEETYLFRLLIIWKKEKI